MILAALLLLASCSLAPVSGSATPQDRRSILEVIRGGMAAEYTAFIPIPPVCPGPVPATVREQLVTQAPIRLGVYFTSPQLEKEIAIVTGVVTNPKGAARLHLRSDGLSLSTLRARVPDRKRFRKRNRKSRSIVVISSQKATL